ncbi:hypothetical protein KAR91_38960 [Candidatus Pacearchaeota archaeon]|nr:hypothetical protein [Candidatus Pacearchaeota archaeon]
MSAICLNNLPGVRSLCKSGNPITGLQGLVFSDPDFSFATASSFADSDDWATGIAAGQLFPVMGIKEEEDTTPDDTIWESSYGDKVDITEGKYSTTYSVHYTLEQHKRLREYTGKKWKIFKIDRNNNIMATINEDGEYVGFDISYLKVAKMIDPTADSPSLSPIRVEETDPNQWNTSGQYVTPSWLASEEIQALAEVNITSTTVASNVFTVTVNYFSGLNSDGSNNNIPIQGLLAANFEIIDQAGAILSDSGDYTVTESTTVLGSYEIDATVGTITSGSVQVIATAAALYRSDVLAIVAA